MPPAGVTRTAAPCRTSLIASNQLLFKYNICWAYVGAEPAAPARVLWLAAVRCLLMGEETPGREDGVRVPRQSRRRWLPQKLQPPDGEGARGKKPRARAAKNSPEYVLPAPLSGGWSVFGRGLTDGDWKKILRKKRRVWAATQSRSNFFQWKTAFWSNKAIHVKTETFCGNTAMSGVFYFGKGKPPKAF